MMNIKGAVFNDRLWQPTSWQHLLIVASLNPYHHPIMQFRALVVLLLAALVSAVAVDKRGQF